MENSFSIQMKNSKSVSGIALSRSKKGFFLEGELGIIEDIELIEEKVLTITGKNGTIRIDINKEELIKALNPIIKNRLDAANSKLTI